MQGLKEETLVHLGTSGGTWKSQGRPLGPGKVQEPSRSKGKQGRAWPGPSPLPRLRSPSPTLSPTREGCASLGKREAEAAKEPGLPTGSPFPPDEQGQEQAG